jgi:hypothetical protein
MWTAAAWWSRTASAAHTQESMPPLSSTTARLRLLVAFGAAFDPEFDSMTSSRSRVIASF